METQIKNLIELAEKFAEYGKAANYSKSKCTTIDWHDDFSILFLFHKDGTYGINIGNVKITSYTGVIEFPNDTTTEKLKTIYQRALCVYYALPEINKVKDLNKLLLSL